MGVVRSGKLRRLGHLATTEDRSSATCDVRTVSFRPGRFMSRCTGVAGHVLSRKTDSGWFWAVDMLGWACKNVSLTSIRRIFK